MDAKANDHGSPLDLPMLITDQRLTLNHLKPALVDNETQTILTMMPQVQPQDQTRSNIVHLDHPSTSASTAVPRPRFDEASKLKKFKLKEIRSDLTSKLKKVTSNNVESGSEVGNGSITSPPAIRRKPARKQSSRVSCTFKFIFEFNLIKLI